MKKLFILIALFFTFVLSAQENQKKQIFILHSYSQEYAWTKSQHNAFVSTLSQRYAVPPDVKVEYLDTKRLGYDSAYQSFFLDYLLYKYSNYFPDAIYVTDDNALKFFLQYKELLFYKAPLFFSGINDHSLIESLVSRGFKGVLETKDIRPNIELIRQFSPQTRDIWIVGDTSTTFAAIEKEIRKIIPNYPNHTLHVVSSKKIENVLKALPEKPKTFVLLTTIGEWEDENGNVLSINDSISRLMQYPELIICSMEDSYITGGVIGGYVTSGTEQGTAAAQMVIRSFENNSSASVYPISESPNIYMFDRHALIKSRIVLSEYIARNAVVLNESKSFFLAHHDTLVNVFFVTTLFAIVLLIITIFMFWNKKRMAKNLQSEFHAIKLRYETLSEIIGVIEKNCFSGYWVWDREAYTCAFSNGFKNILQLDTLPQQENINALMQHIHPNDIERVEEAIDKVLSNAAPVTLNHRLLCGDGSTRSVVHVISPVVAMSEGNRNILMGIIKDEHA